MADANQIRINELARELEIKAKVLIDYLPEIGVTEKKTHSSSIDVEHAELARKHFQGLAEAEAAAEAAKSAPKPKARPAATPGMPAPGAPLRPAASSAPAAPASGVRAPAAGPSGLPAPGRPGVVPGVVPGSCADTAASRCCSAASASCDAAASDFGGSISSRRSRLDSRKTSSCARRPQAWSSAAPCGCASRFRPSSRTGSARRLRFTASRRPRHAASSSRCAWRTATGRSAAFVGSPEPRVRLDSVIPRVPASPAWGSRALALRRACVPLPPPVQWDRLLLRLVRFGQGLRCGPADRRAPAAPLQDFRNGQEEAGVGAPDRPPLAASAPAPPVPQACPRLSQASLYMRASLPQAADARL